MIVGVPAFVLALLLGGRWWTVGLLAFGGFVPVWWLLMHALGLRPLSTNLLHEARDRVVLPEYGAIAAGVVVHRIVSLVRGRLWRRPRWRLLQR